MDEDNLPLLLQETGLNVGGVSEFERGLAVIANRKKDDEDRKKAKAARCASQENQGGAINEKMAANKGKEKHVVRGTTQKPRARAR